MKYFTTRYTLSSGKIEEEELVTPTPDGYLFKPDSVWGTFKLGRDAFADRSDAVKAAEVARAKKIASLKKQIAKLEKMTF